MGNKVTEKEKKVYKILLTPIKCDKKVSKIYMKDGFYHYNYFSG